MSLTRVEKRGFSAKMMWIVAFFVVAVTARETELPVAAAGIPENVPLDYAKAEESTEMLPDMGASLIPKAKAVAWRIQGLATEQRAKMHAEIATNGAKGAVKAAEDAKTTSAEIAKYLPGVKSEAEAATKERETAQTRLEEVKQIYKETKQKAYEAALASAQGAADTAWKNGEAYFESLMAAWRARQKPVKDPKAEAAAAAAKPYFDAQLMATNLVAMYNLHVQELILASKQLAKLGHKLAGAANIAQASNQPENAQKLMIQAHDMMTQSQLKADLAKNVHKLAENLNLAIPEYQSAASAAAIHVLATWSGLQVSETPKKAPLLQREKDMKSTMAENKKTLAMLGTEIADAEKDAADLQNSIASSKIPFSTKK